MGPRVLFSTAVLLCDASFGKADVQSVSTKATGQLQGFLRVLISPAASAACFVWLYCSQSRTLPFWSIPVCVAGPPHVQLVSCLDEMPSLDQAICRSHAPSTQLQTVSSPRQEAFCLLANSHPFKKTGLQMVLSRTPSLMAAAGNAGHCCYRHCEPLCPLLLLA